MTPQYQVLRALLLACCLLVPRQAHAFKIDTHLWIGQQVINDLEDDGRITILLGGRAVTLPVPAEVASAVLEHRSEYLLGNIGPDAIPDLVVGQTLVHPGSSQGWKTNDWLRFLLVKSRGNPLGTAFSHGYLAHAAADVFAHTYVNQYAGDAFVLADETLVEQRHMALESFISRFNPPLVNGQGQSLGAAWQLVQPSDALAAFVRDTLIYETEPAVQYGAGQYSKHLAGYRSYREALRSAAEQPIWREIDNAVLQAIASYYGYDVSPEIAGELIDFVNGEIIPRVQKRVDLSQEQFNRLNATLDYFDTVRYEAVHGELRRIADLHTRIASKLAERLDAEGRLCWTVTEAVCHNVACCIIPAWPFGCALEDPLCRRVCDQVARLQCPISESVGNAAADLIRQIDGELNGTNGMFEQLLQAAHRLRDQALIAKNSSIDLAQRLIDLGQVVSNDTSPIKALLDNWRRDLDVAMAAYVKAATSSMINTMNPASRELPQGSITPMVEWWDCYHLTLVGLPAPVGTGACGFRGSLEATWRALENIAKVLEDTALLAPSQAVGLPSPAQVRAEIERLKTKATEHLTNAAIDAFTDLLSDEVQDLMAVLEDEMTDERLRHYFTKPETSGAKGLLMIDDVDQRVKAEMKLRPGGTSYDPQEYAVVYDAVVLAKLALLDNAGLTVLATEAGVPATISGGALFAGTSNILSDAVSSIDGNHQWMTVAPPRPNSSGAPYARVALEGYPWPQGYASAAGFVPWQSDARDALFRSLFIGPLSPGVEAPGELGFPELLPATYPYRPCVQYPFPNDEYDTTCASVYGAEPGPAPIRSALTLSVSSTQVPSGLSVTLTVVVSGSDPRGSVVFFDDGATIGTAALTDGRASLTTAALASGQHAFTASYRGDGQNLATSSESALLVQVEAARRPPSVEAGPDRFVSIGATITLTGVAVDPDGGALRFAWRLVAGTTLELHNAQSAAVSFTAATAGASTLELTVTDETGLSASDQISVTARVPVRPPIDDCPRPRNGTRCIPR